MFHAMFHGVLNFTCPFGCTQALDAESFFITRIYVFDLNLSEEILYSLCNAAGLGLRDLFAPVAGQPIRRHAMRFRPGAFTDFL